MHEYVHAHEYEYEYEYEYEHEDAQAHVYDRAWAAARGGLFWLHSPRGLGYISPGQELPPGFGKMDSSFMEARARRPSWRAAAFVVIVLGIAGVGCGGLRAASAGLVGCRPDDVEISDDQRSLGTRTWTATCNGRAFSCSHVQTGQGSAQISCAPMAGPTRVASASRAAPQGGDTPTRAARVQRGFDAQRKIAYVKGSFALDGGMQAIVLGAPAAAPGRLSVVLSGPAPRKDVRECKALTLLVNAQPSEPATSTDRGRPGGINVESSFQASAFQPLTGSYPEFAVRACVETWRFDEAQVAELQKLLAIYAEMEKETAAATSGGESGASPASVAL